jgi:single-strand DNA-binding protein
MSNSFNAVVTLGRDSEIRQLPSGALVLSFTAANNIGFGDKQQTIWVRCSMFGARGEKLSQYLTKGTKVWVTGELTVREYNGNDGATKYSIELNVRDLALLGGNQPDKQPSPVKQKEYDTFDDTNITF